MARLTHHNFGKLLGCIAELSAHHDLDSFPRFAMTVGRKLISADYVVWDEINMRRKRHTWLADPVAMDLSGPDEAHAHLFADHPFVKHMQATGDVPALLFSDFLTRRQYHETGLYREAYRDFGVEFQMGFSLPSPSPSFFVGLAFNRRLRDFSEEDRLTCDLLRPHLLQAYRNAELITQLQEQARFSQQALEVARQGMVALNAKGRVRFCSAKAREWLAAYCVPDKNAAADKLPQMLRQWLRQQPSPAAKDGHIPPPQQPLALERNGCRLLVRLISGSIPGQRILVLEERPITLSSAPLCRLGLTLREAEVLLWVAQGKTSPDIGQIIGCSTATVNKHLEHIFAKLGVETRTTAAVRALEVLQKNAA